MSEPAPIRASDAERDATVERLRGAAAEGRLTFGELSDRVGRALAASDGAQLDALTSDLPAPASEARPVARGAARRVAVAVMGRSDVGHGRVAGALTAVAVMGRCVVDLTEATVDGDEVTVTAVCAMGAVEVIVPAGVQLVDSGVVVMGRRETDPAPPAPAGAPVVRVRGFGTMGRVSVFVDGG